MRLLSIFILLNATTVFGQLRVTGKVVDAMVNEPLPGVNIVVKGTPVAIISNTEGEFVLNIPSDSAVIRFSFFGYKPYEIKVYESSFVEIALQETVIVIDYFKPLKLVAVNKKECDRIDMKSALEFINDSFINDTSKFNLSSESVNGMLRIDSLILSDTVFNAEDVKFICLQLACISDFRWKKKQIKGARIIKEREESRIFKESIERDGWIKFRKKYGECLSTFGVPLFTVNGEYCIFHWWIQCDYLAGGGNLDLYKKTNGKWERVKTYRRGRS